MNINNMDLAREYFEAVDSEDLGRLRNLFSESAQLQSAGGGTRQGIDSILKFYSRVFIKFPVHSDTPRRWIENESTVVVEIDFKGVSKGGTAVEFKAVDIFDFQDGLIFNLSQWVDTAAIEKALSHE